MPFISQFSFGFLLLSALLLAVLAEGGIVTRHELLKPEEYFVEWRVDTVEEYINFTITARTKGYLGLGLSYTGGMASADIVTAGVDSNGSCYVQDRFARGEMTPEIDEQQDWTCFQGVENATHTQVVIGRKLNTCDKKDIPINVIHPSILLYSFVLKFPYHHIQFRTTQSSSSGLLGHPMTSLTTDTATEVPWL